MVSWPTREAFGGFSQDPADLIARTRYFGRCAASRTSDGVAP